AGGGIAGMKRARRGQHGGRAGRVTLPATNARGRAGSDPGRPHSPRLNPFRDTHASVTKWRKQMAFTRAQATELLNKAEMRLYDDSRANALRGLDRAALAGRATRARASRDRARDMLKRQRVAARKRGDSKATGPGGVAARTARKEELLAEILGRFVEARRTAPEVVAKKATAKKATAKKATAKKATAKRASGKKGTTKKAAQKKVKATKTRAK